MVARRVVIYINSLPQPTGSGAQLRFYSNVQAYLDLGWDVELVVVSPSPGGEQLPPELSRARVTFRKASAVEPGALGKLAFRAALPNRAAFRLAFPYMEAVISAAREFAGRFGDTLHHFEGEDMASALPFLRLRRALWSFHDIPSGVSAASSRISASAEDRTSPSAPEKREFQFLQRAESRMARCAPLILTISEVDRTRWRRTGHPAVETLPMSIPYESELFAERRQRQPTDELRLLHLGRTAHLPSFLSLKYIIGEVFPLLPAEVLRKTRLLVAGRCDGDDHRSVRIRELSARFPEQVRLLGFVENLDDLYSSSDLQLVAATEATGLRTRIVESFARGLPVLSTSAAADGILGLEVGRNILIEDTARGFARALEDQYHRRTDASAIASGAHLLYRRFYSRAEVARQLERFLRQAFGGPSARAVSSTTADPHPQPPASRC